MEHNGQVPAVPFRVEADARARAWLSSHPAAGRRVIDYVVHRCCGGGRICLVHVREQSPKDDPDGFATGTLDDGTPFLIDRRAAARLPSTFRLTVRGVGPLKHLDLDLESEEWGELLYT
jgi:hypothetical protein